MQRGLARSLDGGGSSHRQPGRGCVRRYLAIEGRVQAQIVDSTFTLAEADTCCAPGYTAVTLANTSTTEPAFIFMADESPLHRKLGVYEVRG